MKQANAEESSFKKAKRNHRSFRKNGLWYFQFTSGMIFGPFDKVFDTTMKDREFEERELDNNEATELLLEFA